MSVTLKDAILKLAATYGSVSTKVGIVFVTTPDGEVWSFTVPMKEPK